MPPTLRVKLPEIVLLPARFSMAGTVLRRPAKLMSGATVMLPSVPSKARVELPLLLLRI